MNTGIAPFFGISVLIKCDMNPCFSREATSEHFRPSSCFPILIGSLVHLLPIDAITNYQKSGPSNEPFIFPEYWKP